MPAPPPSVTSNFDIVDTAMNMARVQVNDCPLALSGNLLDDTQPYAQTFYNLAWRDFQSDMAQAGDPAQTEEALILGLPPVATIDPGVQTFLSQTQFFDGVGYFAPPTVQVLPQSLICPLWVRERLAGSMQLFSNMVACDNGLPGGPKTTFNRYWEWRGGTGTPQVPSPLGGNAIFMPGATVSRDLWIRFASYIPDAVDNFPIVDTPWYQQPISMFRCADALGFYIAAKFAFSRGSDQAVAIGNSFLEQGRNQMRKLLNQTTMKIRQRVNHRRRPFSGGRHQGWAWY